MHSFPFRSGWSATPPGGISPSGERRCRMSAIAPEVLRSLRNLQKEVLIVLAEHDRPMCQQEINDQFEKKKNLGRLADALEILVLKGFVEESTEHLTKVFQVVTSKLQNVTSRLQNVTSKLQNVTRNSHDSYMNHDSCDSDEINSKKKRKNLNFSSSQASVSTAPVVAAEPAVDVCNSSATAPAAFPPCRDKRIFGEDLPMETYLDRMLAEFGETTMQCTELDLPTSKQDVFRVALREAHLKITAAKYTGVREFVFHMLAFAVAMEFTGYAGRKEGNEFVSGIDFLKRKIDEWIHTCRTSPVHKKVAMHVLILEDLKPKYIAAGYGWYFPKDERNYYLPKTSMTTDWEYDRVRKGLISEFRKELHPVRAAWDRTQTNNRSFAKVKAQIAAEKVQKEQEKIQERQERIAKGDVGEQVMNKISENLGDQNFDLWFGPDTRFDNDECCFYVQNDFARKSIRRHCTIAIQSALSEFGFTEAPIFRLHDERPP